MTNQIDINKSGALFLLVQQRLAATEDFKDAMKSIEVREESLRALLIEKIVSPRLKDYMPHFFILDSLFAYGSFSDEINLAPWGYENYKSFASDVQQLVIAWDGYISISSTESRPGYGRVQFTMIQPNS